MSGWLRRLGRLYGQGLVYVASGFYWITPVDRLLSGPPPGHPERLTAEPLTENETLLWSQLQTR